MIAWALGFSGIRYRSGSWFGNIRGQAIQADLVFDRADNVLTVCEMKYVREVKADVVSAIERRSAAIAEHYGRPVQKVLVQGSRGTLSAGITKAFDAVLYAEEVFFRI